MFFRKTACKFYAKPLLLAGALFLIALNARASGRHSRRQNVPLVGDSAHKDSTHKGIDTLNVPISQSAIPSEIKYNAKDSIIFDVDTKKAYLYGKSHITYQDIVLDAERIVIDWNTSEVTAEGGKDSNGRPFGNPLMKQGGETFNADRLVYNFQTKKGKVYGLVTHEGEGYIHVPEGKYLKTDTNNVVYARDAKYTTCDLPDPHFYIQANKLKIIPKDKVITGLAFMYVEKVPIPLLLPFGFFPAQSRRSSGLVFPLYGEDANRGGFFLKQGGYYFGLSDYFDVKITGDIYANGGWGTNLLTNYAKRYQSSGNVSFGFSHLKLGLADTRDEALSKEFIFHWSHQQDPRALPGVTFSSNVNIQTSKYLQNNSLDINQRLTNNLSSNVLFGKLFKIFGTTANLSTALRHSQNVITRQMDLQLPQIDFNISRFTPFKSHAAVVKPHWYENIGLDYNADYTNNIHTSDTVLFKENFLHTLRTSSQQAFKHGSNLTTNFKLFNYFTLTPAIRYDGWAYFRKDVLEYNSAAKKIDTFTTKGLFYAHHYDFSASLSTTAYGTFQVHKLGIEAIRHVFTPTVSLRYTPDFGPKSNYGYYRTYRDSLGSEHQYSVFMSSLNGVPNIGHFGGIDFGLNNSLEMKVRSRKDTSVTSKKVKILDRFSINSSYNFLKDTLKLDPFNIQASTSVFEKIMLSGQATVDPYHSDSLGHAYNKFMLTPVPGQHAALGRLTSANFAMSLSLNPKAQKKEQEKRREDPRIGYYYPGTYVDFTVPWNMSVSYGVYYTNSFVRTTHQLSSPTNLTQSLNVSGAFQLTPNWKIDFSTNFDIKKADLSTTRVNIYRDLHCWEMRFQWVPFGAYKSYYFTVNIKAPSLRDLKYDKRVNNQVYYK